MADGSNVNRPTWGLHSLISLPCGVHEDDGWMLGGESTALPGFDQDSYVASAKFNQLRWAQLQTDFDNVRSATLSLITTIDELAWTRKGTVWNHPVSARAIAYIIAGHERHHLTVIRDRYL